MTNKPVSATNMILETLSLADFFPVVIGGDSLPKRKPDPAQLFEAARQLGVNADQALMVGDNIHDVEAAHAAGMRCVAVSYGYHHRPPSEFDADHLIDRFDELPPLVINPTSNRSEDWPRSGARFPTNLSSYDRSIERVNQSVATLPPFQKSAVEVNGRTYAAPKRPTVVIIVDGFDPAYLEHGIANGTLPTMKSFKENGFVGIADCSMPSTTNTNNTSIVTGVPPVVHGINGNYYLDAETGEEIMITDAKRLRCGTILGAFSHVGVKTAVVTAKDKLLKVLAYQMDGHQFLFGICRQGKPQGQRHRERREAGRAADSPTSTPPICRLFVFDAGVKLLSTVSPDLMYLSTSDYVQHKHGPGEPEADAYHHAVDKTVAN